jgi:ABC-type multidrug transport system ATPase subunit
VSPTRLEFRPGLNLVLGKNAAGKTTLLNLLADSLFGLSPVEERQNIALA